MDYKGDIISPLNVDDVENAVDLMIHEGVEAVAVCFMNAFMNDQHEEDVHKIIQPKLPDVYLTVSSRILPSIRFYDRVSTTVLNSYVGPTLKRYLSALISKLHKLKYEGILLIMQSNGGVISPEQAIKKPAATLLSGPAGGPVAGVEYTAVQGYSDCITVDMGGTSFDASMVKDKVPMVTTSGEINRLRLALPMLNVVNIPDGVDDPTVRRALLDRGVEIAPGFGPLNGKTWRVGLMGVNADPERINRLLGALEEVLN